MVYRQAFEIEQRLERALRLIESGRYSTPQLAEALNVSIPTVSRCVQALRERGFDVRAARRQGAWSYFLGRKSKLNGHRIARSHLAHTM
jgi:biotin operon repressor